MVHEERTPVEQAHASGRRAAEVRAGPVLEKVRELLSAPGPLAAPVVLWRCTVCGHWSHAKRKPQHHPRTIRNLDELDPLPEGRVCHAAIDEANRLALPVLRYFALHPWSGDPDTDPDLGGLKVACGPFERWVAYRG